MPSIEVLFHLLHPLMLDSCLRQFVTKKESEFYEVLVVMVRALVFKGSAFEMRDFDVSFFISMYICFVLFYCFCFTNIVGS